MRLISKENTDAYLITNATARNRDRRMSDFKSDV